MKSKFYIDKFKILIFFLLLQTLASNYIVAQKLPYPLSNASIIKSQFNNSGLSVKGITFISNNDSVFLVSNFKKMELDTTKSGTYRLHFFTRNGIEIIYMNLMYVDDSIKNKTKGNYIGKAFGIGDKFLVTLLIKKNGKVLNQSQQKNFFNSW